MLDELKRDYVGKHIDELAKHLKSIGKYYNIVYLNSSQTAVYDGRRVNVCLDENDKIVGIVFIG